MTMIQSIAKTLPTNHQRLWLRDRWFIPVDDEGCCIGECAEGALGFVIKLHCEDRPNSFLALKIPRLVGDTHRENAYIGQLMEQELHAVRQVFEHHLGNEVATSSLLNIGTIGLNLLRGPILTDPSHEEASKWNQAIVIMGFVKGEKPRFCLVRKEEGQLHYFPHLAEVKRPIIDAEAFDEIASTYKWAYPLFLEIGHGRIERNIFPINDAFDERPTGVTWYTSVPSVTYVWAPQTLQESISRGLRGAAWDVRKDLKLVENICSGLRALHTRGMLHADVRPANIVINGDPREPMSYYLSDYGSFAPPNPHPLDHHQSISPGTQLGPVVVGERASAFYAPERRLGREREASDTAVFLNDGAEDDKSILLLGWRSDLVDNQGQVLISKVREYIKAAQFATLFDEFADTILKKGDRIQIREYIFELAEDERRLGDKQIFTCKRNYWQIYHGRIAVEVSADNSFGPLTWMPIPRTVELLKWSVSTDLYSLGVLILYSIFRRKFEQTQQISNASIGTEEKTVSRETHSEGLQGAQHVDASKVEEQFREMLTYLNSVPYFNAIWPELDWLRFQMEEKLKDKTLNSQTFAGTRFIRHDQTEQTDPNEPQDLREAAVDLTKRLTQTAPGVYDLVAALNFNLANFIFLIHFALSCLHREAHLSHDARQKSETKPEWIKRLPFCRDRHEIPGESHAARDALERLVYLQGIIDQFQLGAMVPDSQDEIRPYDPRPDVSIRVERDRLELERDQLEKEKDDLTTELDHLEKAKTDLLAEIRIIHDALDSKHTEYKQEQALVDELIILNEALRNTLGQYAQFRQSVDEIVPRNSSQVQRIRAPELGKLRELLNKTSLASPSEL